MHPDEGTIHAWIDGALDPTEAVQLEAHVQSCETCKAAVAEARGFVAASSRILSALDDVPANVLPRSDNAAPVSTNVKQMRRIGWGQTMAIAAGIVVMVTGSFYVLNESGVVPAPFDATELASKIATTEAAERARAQTFDSAAVARPAPRAGVADGRGVGNTVAGDSASRAGGVTGGVASAATARVSRAEQRSAADAAASIQALKVKPSQPVAQADAAANQAAAPPPLPVPPATRMAAAAGSGSTVGSASGRTTSAFDSIRRGSTGSATAPAPVAPALERADLRMQSNAFASNAALPASEYVGCYEVLPDRSSSQRQAVDNLPNRLRLTDSIRAPAAGARRYVAVAIDSSDRKPEYNWSPSVGGVLQLYYGTGRDARAVSMSIDTGARNMVQLRRVQCR